MKLLASTILIIAALVVYTTSVLAGPLTGAPAIKFELDGDKPTTQGIGGNLAIGLSNFTFKLNLPPQSDFEGVRESVSSKGIIISGELYKTVSKNGNAFKFGAWHSSPKGTSLSEVHAGYKFNRNWGIEIGQFLGDAKENWGSTSYHITYDFAPPQEGKLAFQVGIGGMTKTSVPPGLGLGEPDMERTTSLSAFANANLGLSNNITLNVGVWFLKQKLRLPAWDILGIPIPEIIAFTDTFQYTVSLGLRF